jgi:hypothetical protein
MPAIADEAAAESTILRQELFLRMTNMNILFDVVLSYVAYTVIVAVAFSSALVLLLYKEEIRARVPAGGWNRAGEVTVEGDNQGAVAN